MLILHGPRRESDDICQGGGINLIQTALIVSPLPLNQLN